MPTLQQQQHTSSFVNTNATQAYTQGICHTNFTFNYTGTGSFHSHFVTLAQKKKKKKKA